jgi:plastocyanin
MKKLAVPFALLLVAATFAACGGSDSTADDGGEGSAGSTVELETDPNATFTFTSTEASATAGEVTIDFKNPQSFDHVVNIENSKGQRVGETQTINDDSTTLELQMKPGTYYYYCSVPGHRKGGMEGTLTVESPAS